MFSAHSFQLCEQVVLDCLLLLLLLSKMWTMSP